MTHGATMSMKVKKKAGGRALAADHPRDQALTPPAVRIRSRPPGILGPGATWRPGPQAPAATWHAILISIDALPLGQVLAISAAAGVNRGQHLAGAAPSAAHGMTSEQAPRLLG